MNEVTVSGEVTWREAKNVNTKNGPAVVVEVKLKGDDGLIYRGNVWSESLHQGANSLSRGDKATLKGRLNKRTWVGNDGEERTSNDVYVTSILGFGGAPAKSKDEQIEISPAGAGKIHVLVKKSGVSYAGIINEVVKTSSAKAPAATAPEVTAELWNEPSDEDAPF